MDHGEAGARKNRLSAIGRIFKIVRKQANGFDDAEWWWFLFGGHGDYVTLLQYEFWQVRVLTERL